MVSAKRKLTDKPQIKTLNFFYEKNSIKISWLDKIINKKSKPVNLIIHWILFSLELSEHFDYCCCLCVILVHDEDTSLCNSKLWFLKLTVDYSYVWNVYHQITAKQLYQLFGCESHSKCER